MPFGAPVVVPPPGIQRPETYSAWNPADKHANVTLTAGNLTAEGTTAGTFRSVRGTHGVSSGKWYWEAQTSSVDTAGLEVGVATAAAGLAANVAATQFGWTQTGNTANKRHNNAFSAYGVPWNPGDVLSVLLDMDAATLSYWVNGISLGVAFSNLTGPIFPAVSLNFRAVKISFGSKAFVYTPPAGFVDGMGLL